MKNIIDFIKRNSIWFILGLCSLIVIKPDIPEIKTILLVVSMECISICLAGLSAFAYTKIDFTKESINSNLGFIFLGVNICVGLCVLGVYIAQFSN